MPWKESNLMDERIKFVARLLDGEKMTVVCRDFGISRKTGYKIVNRYKQRDLQGLADQTRRPHPHSLGLPWPGQTPQTAPLQGQGHMHYFNALTGGNPNSHNIQYNVQLNVYLIVDSAGSFGSHMIATSSPFDSK